MGKGVWPKKLRQMKVKRLKEIWGKGKDDDDDEMLDVEREHYPQLQGKKGKDTGGGIWVWAFGDEPQHAPKGR